MFCSLWVRNLLCYRAKFIFQLAVLPASLRALGSVESCLHPARIICGMVYARKTLHHIITSKKYQRMGKFDLETLKQIKNQREILDYLVENDVIREKAFLREVAYEKELARLQLEFLKMQNFLIKEQKPLLIIVEGRDAAGKGGTISRMIKPLNPKKFRVMALSKPTPDEQRQWYFQRYIAHLPKRGEIVFMDRSWYNRAVVEQVFGFSTKEQYATFMDSVLNVEKTLKDDGFIIVKLFLDITKDEQKERLDARVGDPLKEFKMGELDAQAIEKWDDYTHYIDTMWQETATKDLPWVIIRTDRKKDARIQAMKYVLNQVKMPNKDTEELDDNIVKIYS